MQYHKVSWAMCLLNFSVYIFRSSNNQQDPNLKTSDFLSDSTLRPFVVLQIHFNRNRPHQGVHLWGAVVLLGW